MWTPEAAVHESRVVGSPVSVMIAVRLQRRLRRVGVVGSLVRLDQSCRDDQDELQLVGTFGPSDLSLFLLGLAACAFALSLFVLLPFDRVRRLRSDLPFAVAIAPPPAMAVMIPRALS